MDQSKCTELSSEIELDDLALRILTLMNEYISSKKSIENYIRSGCLDLAKARYIVGNRNISALQLPRDDSVGVTAKFRIVRSSSEDNFPKFLIIEGDDNADKTLIDNLEEMNLNSEDNSSRKILRSSKDPLKWFGFLVPQNLKQSKVTFEKCLDIIVECANIQSELKHDLMEYRERRKLIAINS